MKKILDQELYVRKVEELVRNLSKDQENGENPSTQSSPNNRSIDYESLKTHLQTFFSANVEFKRNNNGKGRIVIPFKTDDELERIIAIFDKLNT